MLGASYAGAKHGFRLSLLLEHVDITVCFYGKDTPIYLAVEASVSVTDR